MTETLVRRWLSLLLLAPVLAILQLLLFPRRPQAAALPPPPETVFGSWKLVNEQPARRERDLDTSPSRTYAIQEPPPTGQTSQPGLQLNLTSLAVRTTPTLQVASLTASNTALQLRERRLLKSAGDGQLAVGQIADRPAWQTCLLPNGRSAVTAVALREARSALGSQQTQPPPQWSRWLGIRDHPGHECLLVTISIDGPANPAVAATMQPLVEDFIAELASRS